MFKCSSNRNSQLSSFEVEEVSTTDSSQPSVSHQFLSDLQTFHQNADLIPEEKNPNSNFDSNINVIDLNTIPYNQIKLQKYKKEGPLRFLDKFLPLNKYMGLKALGSTSNPGVCKICY
jgi:hypothetical protein